MVILTPKIDLIPSEGDNPEDVQTVIVKCPLYAECEVMFAYHPSAQQAAETQIREHLEKEHGLVDELADVVPDEAVDHPSYYGGADNPYEAIRVIEAWGLGFCLGNCTKYISRAGRKDPAKEIEDCQKAAWYLNRHIEQLRAKTK